MDRSDITYIVGAGAGLFAGGTGIYFAGSNLDEAIVTLTIYGTIVLSIGIILLAYNKHGTKKNKRSDNKSTN